MKGEDCLKKLNISFDQIGRFYKYHAEGDTLRTRWCASFGGRCLEAEGIDACALLNSQRSQ